MSLAERAKIDLSFMTELTGKPEAEIIEELTGVIFQNPLTEKWETSDEYLSGNVRVKLEVAKQFAENHDRYQVNVQALEKVQPKELEASEIEIRLGATWVDAEYITEFMGELFQTTDHVGIVEKCENGTVYTVEGNSGDACKQRQYAVGSSNIYGYGIPAY